MAKITSVIDIGSNSVRLVVFEKSSRFGFFLINETKLKIKIGEGGYVKGGELQAEPMDKAFEAIKLFKQISQNLKARKILIVATSALRDAPNKSIFINKVSKKLKLNIRVIDGQKEAYYGQVAVSNLLDIKNFFTIDTGGGSTEMAFVKDGKNMATYSLNIGTVRLKELYFDYGDIAGAKKFVVDQLSQIDTKSTASLLAHAVVLGGSARAISSAIIKQTNYPLDIVHGFRYDVETQKQIFDDILKATTDDELKQIGIKEDRYDTIKAGCFILQVILEFFAVQKVTSSQVGVREGVYLCDILRTTNHRFPANFHISQRALIDRFGNQNNHTVQTAKLSCDIFDQLHDSFALELKDKNILKVASNLHKIGQMLNFHNNTKLSSSFILYGLDYGFSHKDRVLIATIIDLTRKDNIQQKHIEKYSSLLPNIDKIRKLVFILKLSIVLSKTLCRQKHMIQYDENSNRLTILADHFQATTKDEIDKMTKDLTIIYKANDD